MNSLGFFRVGAAVLAAASFPVALPAQVFVIEDGLSSSGDYTSFYFTSPSNPADVSYSYVDSFVDGGNPGEYFDLIHEHEVDRDELGAPSSGNGSTMVQTGMRLQNVTYTPSVGGAVATLDFSIDYRATDPFTEIFFFVEVAGNGRLAGFTNSLTLDGDWHTVSVTGLTPEDFPGLDMSSNLPLRFGFGALTTEDVTAAPVTYSMSVDNFRVAVTPVPEPGAPGLAAVAAALACRRRRRTSGENPADLS